MQDKDIHKTITLNLYLKKCDSMNMDWNGSGLGSANSDGHLDSTQGEISLPGKRLSNFRERNRTLDIVTYDIVSMRLDF